MATVIWTPLAEAELEDILYYIGVECLRPMTAERIGIEIRDAVDNHLRIGCPIRRHPNLPEHWSYLKHKRWLIAFEQVADGIVVRRIVDAVRNLPEQFEGE